MQLFDYNFTTVEYEKNAVNNILKQTARFFFAIYLAVVRSYRLYIKLV